MATEIHIVITDADPDHTAVLLNGAPDDLMLLFAHGIVQLSRNAEDVYHDLVHPTTGSRFVAFSMVMTEIMRQGAVILYDQEGWNHAQR